MIFSQSHSLIYVAVDDPFTDSRSSHTAIKPASPSPKQHVPLAPLLESQGKDDEELAASSTTLSNPPTFVLPLSSEGNTSAEHHQYPPAIPPAIPLATNPAHYQYPLAESNTGPGQHLPVTPPPAPLPPNPAHYQYPLPYFPYPDMYCGDPRAIYGVHHPCNLGLQSSLAYLMLTHRCPLILLAPSLIALPWNLVDCVNRPLRLSNLSLSLLLVRGLVISAIASLKCMTIFTCNKFIFG